jgi:hypothetical protein
MKMPHHNRAMLIISALLDQTQSIHYFLFLKIDKIGGFPPKRKKKKKITPKFHIPE